MMQNFVDELNKFDELLDFPNKCITFFGSARLDDSSQYCRMAKNLAYKLNQAGFAIISGGGGGIMEAVNRGAFESDKAPSIGLNVVLPFEQFTNKYATTSFVFSNLSVRKFALIDRSIAFIVFPGGFGTLDELFEILVLAQIGTKKAKIYLVGSKFWSGLDSFIRSTLVNEKVISRGDLDLYKISDDIDEVASQIIG
jgi:TIGR00730 family protein